MEYIVAMFANLRAEMKAKHVISFEAICRARWLIHLYFLYTSQFSRNQIFLRIRSTTSCERSDAFKFPLITVVDSITETL